MKRIISLFVGAAIAHGISANDVIVSTSAYSWHGDTITQGEYMATAPTPFEINSTYHAQPGYYMPIEKQWKLKNDISTYPQLITPNTLHTAIYNMALDEMVNAVEPDTTLRTGKAWSGVWTRDVSYSILLSMAYMQTEAAKVSLMKKVNSQNMIIQDTGSGGAWPVSTDRVIWAVAAYEIYKVTGDRSWLEYIYPIIKKSLDADIATVINSENGLVKGETSFIDWREQSHPKWMQTADIFNTETLSTSIVHAQAIKILAAICTELKKAKEAEQYSKIAGSIIDGINNNLWLADKGYYGMYLYGRDNLVMNPRAETLGESLAIMWDIANESRAKSITENNPTTPFGTAIFFPQIADMPSYHNNSLWPWVAAWWTLANAKVGNEDGVMQGFGSIFRPAALFATNKENFNLSNGDIATELNSSNMLWCLSGNIAITHKILFGISFETDGLHFAPFVPKALAATRTLAGLKYRNATINITVSGYGNEIKSMVINGKESKRHYIPTSAKGNIDVQITLANNEATPMKVNNVANVKAPLTPIAWLDNTTLNWTPVYDPDVVIEKYIILRNGKKVGETDGTSFDASIPGEYSVACVTKDGVESFISQPCSTRAKYIAELPNESSAMRSTEIAYQPSSPIKGYNGTGFVEIDHSTPTLNIPINVDQDGTYYISFRYANGNGLVSTENRCASRNINIDGSRIGTIVMPQRGQGKWNDWGMTNSIKAVLDKGSHTVSLEFTPENENMNLKTNHAIIDQIIMVRE